jgi:hypothetical protein
MTNTKKLKVQTSEPEPAPVEQPTEPAAKKNPEAVVDNESTDPFPELGKLRLSQAFLETAGAKKVLTTVPVRKPKKQDFVRVHPDPAFREPFAIIELQDDNERYLVVAEIAIALPTEVVIEMLYTTINRQKVVSLWPVRLPTSDGRVLEWHRSAQEAAERAMQRWIRVTANLSLGAYEITEAPATIPEPEWPQYTFQELLRIGFRDRVIGSFDHPVLKRLRGEC